jgi:hypothetical protein
MLARIKLFLRNLYTLTLTDLLTDQDTLVGMIRTERELYNSLAAQVKIHDGFLDGKFAATARPYGSSSRTTRQIAPAALKEAARVEKIMQPYWDGKFPATAKLPQKRNPKKATTRKSRARAGTGSHPA